MVNDWKAEGIFGLSAVAIGFGMGSNGSGLGRDQTPDKICVVVIVDCVESNFGRGN